MPTPSVSSSSSLLLVVVGTLAFGSLLFISRKPHQSPPTEIQYPTPRSEFSSRPKPSYRVPYSGNHVLRSRERKQDAVVVFDQNRRELDGERSQRIDDFASSPVVDDACFCGDDGGGGLRFDYVPLQPPVAVDCLCDRLGLGKGGRTSQLGFIARLIGNQT
ncbi:hypothetical protein L1987_02426 [Smallanthus sonchifolius]|uniref:Uncharacterized protein n=1 Tax=Smallanthus sonchifolius TaxID=185202 RepID=A0ACB9K7Y6_9ASTR|nr:hypothetical protein L1987_02426 [Smallanthus sonchifolius]